MIDLRSDVCAPATAEMWAAMRSADESALPELERRGAALLGKEAAVFTPTCTSANLAAVLAQTAPGGRAALEERAHVLVAEGDWLTEVARLEPVAVGRPADILCLENTHTRRGGTVLSAAATAELASSYPRTHLDGARLANAAVALGVPLADLAAPVDTVALSLSKGLGAPYGALLAGPHEVIERARVHLKRHGAGTVHRAWLLAAAGLVALDLVGRLAEDHARARRLAALLGLPAPETNIVLTELPASALPALERRGVLALAPDGERVRLVTHRGITGADVEAAARALAELAGPPRARAAT